MTGAGSGLGSGDSLGAMLPHHCVEQMFPDRLTRNEGGIKGPGDCAERCNCYCQPGDGVYLWRCQR